jgi:hypothetical protein
MRVVADAVSDMSASLTVLLVHLPHDMRAKAPPDVRVIETLVHT